MNKTIIISIMVLIFVSSYYNVYATTSIGASQKNGINIGASQTTPSAVGGWTHIINSVANASIAKINGVAKASIAEVNQT